MEIILSVLEHKGLVPSWPSFIEEAIQCGWNLKSLRTKIGTSVGDVLGPEHRKEVLEKFDQYIKTRK